MNAVFTSQIDAVIVPFPGRVSVFAKNLGTGASYERNADTRVQTASTIKVPILVEAFAQVAEGTVHWSDTLTLTDADKQAGAGVLREFHDGLTLTLQDAVNLMIVISDNSATNLVLDHLTSDAVNARMDALGIPEIRSLNKIGGGAPSWEAAADPEIRKFGIGIATPRAMACLLERIERGEVVSPEASKAMIALLKRQQRHDGIGRDLEGVEIASKPGALDTLRSDVGIIYGTRGRIVIAITCDQMPRPLWTVDNPGFLLMALVSRLLVEGLGDGAT